MERWGEAQGQVMRAMIPVKSGQRERGPKGAVPEGMRGWACYPSVLR